VNLVFDFHKTFWKTRGSGVISQSLEIVPIIVVIPDGTLLWINGFFLDEEARVVIVC